MMIQTNQDNVLILITLELVCVHHYTQLTVSAEPLQYFNLVRRLIAIVRFQEKDSMIVTPLH